MHSWKRASQQHRAAGIPLFYRFVVVEEHALLQCTVVYSSSTKTYSTNYKSTQVVAQMLTRPRECLHQHKNVVIAFWTCVSRILMLHHPTFIGNWKQSFFPMNAKKKKKYLQAWTSPVKNVKTVMHCTQLFYVVLLRSSLQIEIATFLRK